MRKLTKNDIPLILEENQETWSEEFVADKKNATKKYRYRHADIKDALKKETGNKCVYCESKIGHNTPGDVEHKTPSSADNSLHFNWDNLTIACTECNRKKLAYFEPEQPFLDPYVDDVETRVLHLGPIVSWTPGDASAETSIKLLQLHDYSRSDLIKNKIETIDKLNNLVARLDKESEPLKGLLLLALERMKKKDSEYSAMVTSVCNQYGL